MNTHTLGLGIHTNKQRAAKLWRRVGVFIAAFVVMGSGPAQMALAAPGDYQWQKAGIAGVAGDKLLNWESIASSNDGNKLAAVSMGIANGKGGYIYTSTDSGATWTERTAAGSRNWFSIASSADGSKLAAADMNNGKGGYIYTSTDSGATWTERTAAGSRWWSSITSSADGSKLVAVDGLSSGSIYTSADSGATWMERTGAGAHSWRSITSSADGSKLAAGVWDGGYIYTSADSGATWTERTAAGARWWRSITSSGDGGRLSAGTVGGYIYTSADSGATWTERTAAGSRDWTSITSSSDGTKLAAVASRWTQTGVASSIYTSADSGATWTARTTPESRYLISIASSGDGTKLAMGTYSGSVYASTDSGATWAEHTIAGLREWHSIVSSADGSKLAVVESSLDGNAYTGSIYTSADSGATWTERTGAGLRSWNSIASSSDGSKLVAVAGSWYSSDSGNHPGSVYTSTDSGATWTERTAAGSGSWNSIASSSDGSKLIADAYGGYMYTSTDSGATWTERTAAGSKYWSQVVSSADGAKLLAGVDGGSLYLSTDFGATWSPITSLNSAGGWYSLAMTPDGKTLFAADAYGSDGNGGTNYDGGYAYISKDGGATWQEQTSLGLRYWNDWASNTGAISADGQTIAIADPYGSDWNDWNGGYIYVTHDSGAHWQAQTALGGKEWTSIAMNSDGSKLAATVDGGSIYLGSVEPPATTTLNLATLPTSSQSATNPAITGAQLSATSSTCYTLDQQSIATLNTTGVTVPAGNTGTTLLGGIAFNLSCATSGGSSNIAITLNTQYPDTTKLRAYKGTGTNLVDITNQVSFTNTVINGTTKTVLSYALSDGGALDEDSTANSTIVDPIYIGLAGDTGASLANTGTNTWLVATAGLLFVLAGIAITLSTTRPYRRVGSVTNQETK